MPNLKESNQNNTSTKHEPADVSESSTLSYETRRPLDESNYVFDQKFTPPYVGNYVLATNQLRDSSVDEESWAHYDIELRKNCKMFKDRLKHFASKKPDQLQIINDYYLGRYIPYNNSSKIDHNFQLVDFLANEATNEQLIDFLKWNRDYVLEIRQEHDKWLKEKFEYIKLDTLNFLQNSGLPIDFQSVVQKMQRLEINYADPFLSIVTETAGEYFIKNEHILISTELLSDHSNEYKTITHELLHAISGRILISGKHESGQYIEHKISRFGYDLNLNYLWLNEAITEQLAQLISNNHRINVTSPLPLTHKVFREDTMDLGTYLDTRQFLKLLLENYQIDTGEELIRNLLIGYFEDYLPDKDAGQRSPYWRECTQKIGDYLTPQALQKINALFISKKIVNSMIKQPPRNPKGLFLKLLGNEQRQTIKGTRSKEEIEKLNYKRKNQGPRIKHKKPNNKNIS